MEELVRVTAHGHLMVAAWTAAIFFATMILAFVAWVVVGHKDVRDAKIRVLDAFIAYTSVIDEELLKIILTAPRVYAKSPDVLVAYGAFMREVQVQNPGTDTYKQFRTGVIVSMAKDLNIKLNPALLVDYEPRIIGERNRLDKDAREAIIEIFKLQVDLRKMFTEIVQRTRRDLPVQNDEPA
jgi:hypothetical protein